MSKIKIPEDIAALARKVAETVSLSLFHKYFSRHSSDAPNV